MKDRRQETNRVVNDRRFKADRIVHSAVNNLLKPYLTSGVVVTPRHSAPECSLADFRVVVSRSVSINFDSVVADVTALINA